MPITRTLGQYLENADGDRRVMAAQTVLWVACVGPVLVFAYAAMEMLLGHPDRFTAPDVLSREAAIDAAWLAAYGVAAYLVNTRRALGGVLGVALFARTIVLGFLRHHLVAFEMGYAVVGIVLILRAARELRRSVASRAH
jgi:hypothetical protein